MAKGQHISKVSAKKHQVFKRGKLAHIHLTPLDKGGVHAETRFNPEPPPAGQNDNMSGYNPTQDAAMTDSSAHPDMASLMSHIKQHLGSSMGAGAAPVADTDNDQV